MLGPRGERRRDRDRRTHGRTRTPAARAPWPARQRAGLPLANLCAELDGGHRPHAAADLGHELVVRKRGERVKQRPLLLPPALKQAVALEHRDVRDRSGTARGVPGIGHAVPEDRRRPGSRQNGSATRSEIMTPPSGRYPLVTPFANTIIDGLTFQRSIPNHVPRRPNAQITASTTSSAPVRSHSSATPSMYPGGGRVHAAGADHRLEEDRGHALRSDPCERLLQVLERVVADLDRLVSGPKPSRLLGMPPSAVPNPWVPW